jgi:hypothetical protein
VVTDVKSLKIYNMSIIKFKKDHASGLKKDAVRDLAEKTANRLIEEGFAVESNQEELEAYRSALSEETKPDYHKDALEAANSSNGDCEDCKGSSKCKDCDDSKEEETIYHVLSQEDIDANGLEDHDLAVGDEVEIDAEGVFVLDEDGELKKKELGNV